MMPMLMLIASLMSVASCQLTVASLPLANGLYVKAAALFSDVPCRNSGIVLEKDQVLAVDRFPHEGALEFESLHWIQVVGHDPGDVDVRGGRDQVRGEHGGPAARLYIDDVMVASVAAGAANADAWRDRVVSLDEVHDAGFEQRDVVLVEVAGAIALVGMRRVFPLAAADDVARIWEAGDDGAGRMAHREAA